VGLAQAVQGDTSLVSTRAHEIHDWLKGRIEAHFGPLVQAGDICEIVDGFYEVDYCPLKTGDIVEVVAAKDVNGWAITQVLHSTDDLVYSIARSRLKRLPPLVALAYQAESSSPSKS